LSAHRWNIYLRVTLPRSTPPVIILASPLTLVWFGAYARAHTGMVGAALAASLAHRPLTRDLRIALIDRGPEPVLVDTAAVSSSPPELRVSTLTPASVDLLRSTGAWLHLEPPRCAAFHTMEVWESSSSGHIRWDCLGSGRTEIAHVAENSLIQAAIWESIRRLRSLPPSSTDPEHSSYHCELLSGSEISEIIVPRDPAWTRDPLADEEGGTMENIRDDDHLASVELRNGRLLHARLLVGADGAMSAVRQAVEVAHAAPCSRMTDSSSTTTTSTSPTPMGWETHCYGQRGVVATVELETGAQDLLGAGGQGVAWQRFLPTGPIALLPVRGGYWNIVWSTTPEMAKYLESLQSDEFVLALNQALQWSSPSTTQQTNATSGPVSSVLSPWLGSVWMKMLLSSRSPLDQFVPPPNVARVVGAAPRSFPLRKGHARRYTSHRVALIGDAAHVVHPLAGQGVNLGLHDVSTLSVALDTMLGCGTDIGDGHQLAKRYGNPARAYNQKMILALDALREAFAQQGDTLSTVRGLGLDLLNISGPMKREIMAYAMGDYGKVVG